MGAVLLGATTLAGFATVVAPDANAHPRPTTTDVDAALRIIADCESGARLRVGAVPDSARNVKTKTYNGTTITASGFYQITRGTWEANGGLAFAREAYLASREQQLIVAKRIVERAGGFGDWDASIGCWRAPVAALGTGASAPPPPAPVSPADQVNDDGSPFEGMGTRVERGVLAEQLIATGRAEIAKGVPYVYGGTSLRTGTDCSGFTQALYRTVGVNLPRTTGQQATFGTAVPVAGELGLGNAQPGDLLLFDTDRDGDINHAGIYVGDGVMLDNGGNRKAPDATGADRDARERKVWMQPVTIRRVLVGGQPAAAPAPSQLPAAGTVTVRAGDTLGRIAAREGGTVQAWFDANRDKIADRNRIIAGQVLRRPGGTSAPAPQADRPPVPTAQYVLPVEGADWQTTRQGFGAPRDGGARKHLGLDLFGNAGAPVRAAHAGVAVLVDNSDNSTAGLTVYIRGDDGFVTVYMHNSRNVVKQGARVAAGEVIAAVGTSGNASRTAPHVHFEVHDRGLLNGGHIDPRPWLRSRGVR